MHINGVLRKRRRERERERERQQYVVRRERAFTALFVTITQMAADPSHIFAKQTRQSLDYFHLQMKVHYFSPAIKTNLFSIT